MNFPRHPLALAALVPLGWLYGTLVRIRNRHYDMPGRARTAGIPVIGVGNLTVGGTGKTPVVQWLCRRLAEEGHRPAVVSRGYGGKAGAGPVVVARGNGPEQPAEVCGDEPRLLAETLPGVVVVAGSDRIAGARAAAGLGATVAVLDDGFQHRRLHRDLDIVLLDCNDPWGNGRLLPAGPLREPVAALGRAGVVLLTRCASGQDAEELLPAIRRFQASAPVCTARHRPAGFTGRDGRERPAPESAFAFCGIARPESFRASLEQAGVRLAGFRSFPDHHRYTGPELQALVDRAAAGGVPLVTTTKDRARLGDGAPEVLALELDLALDDPDCLLGPVRQAVGR